jgi:hypothetical protein
MDMPDVTQAQGGSVAGLAAAIVAAYAAGVHGNALLVLIVCATALAIAIVVSDALIRRGRAAMIGAEQQGAAAYRAMRGTEEIAEEE